MNVAFCINRLALIGLGPTVSSLVRNCSDTGKLNLWFLCAHLQEGDKQNIAKLLTSENYRGTYQFIDFDPVAHFGKFRSLHGDWTPYGRLLIPELLNTQENVLYLDADLTIELDILSACAFDLGNNAVGAVVGAPIKYAIESEFFINEIQLSPEDRYFNSGVLLMNLKIWRLQSIKEQCINLAERYSDNLLAVDQTILNILFSRSFHVLPPAFNCTWYADRQKPNISEKMILHFVGSPKPWDLGGSLIHKGYHNWKKYLNKDWSKAYQQVTLNDLFRVWKIRKSYVRIIKKKLINVR